MFLIRRVKGTSMHPSLPHGKIIVASKRRKPQVGDVVIVRHHRVEVLKRVHDIQGELAYLLGDNPDESTDSRHYGWLPLNAIIGVVLGAKRDQANATTQG